MAGRVSRRKGGEEEGEKKEGMLVEYNNKVEESREKYSICSILVIWGVRR